MTITWEEFIKEISGKRGLSPDQEKTLLARLPSEDQCLAEEIVANELNITLKTVKKRMSKVHKKFKDVLDDYDCFISSSLKKTIVLHEFLKKEYRQRCSSVIPDRSTIPYSDEFEGLIQEKIKDFCGREFVFQEFDRFIQDNTEGYFTVVGNEGMGKTALAAKFVSERQYPHYFNISNNNRNTPEYFRKSMTKDLIERYQLTNAWEYDLQGLIEEKIRQKLSPEQKLILVIDALDEVNQEPGNNLLDLPMTLPKWVYIFLTRRPYNRKTKRLNVAPRIPYFELDLREEEYMQLSERDIKAYIHLLLQDLQYQDSLQHWIEERNLTTENFVAQIAEKSENNFMYLHYLLPALANGHYNDLQLAQLPNGLEEYYQTHWVQMGMESEPNQFMAIILFILKEVETPISSEMIAKIAEQDEAEVDRVLDTWIEYLKMDHLDGECCYRIDRASFLNFLEKQTALKQNRQVFEQVNQRIIDYLEEGTVPQMTIAEKLAAKPPSFQRAYLGRLPYRYAKTEQWEKYRQLLTNFEFIEAKINHPEFGVQALIEDYGFIDAEAENAKVLKLVQGALRMSAHVLQEDSSQLVGQLLGRMLGFKHPEIQQLLAQANQSQTPGLRPLTPSLKPPGGALVCILEGHSDSVNAVALTPDGERAISGSEDKTLKVWNLKTRELEQTLTGHQGQVCAVAVTPDGERAISGSDDKTLKVWNLKIGELKQTLIGHQGRVGAVAVTPDGERAISGSSYSIKVWNLKTGELEQTITGHQSWVCAVAVTLDGQRVISGSEDETLKVWNLKTGELEQTFTGYHHSVSSVAVTPDGQRVISGSFNKTVKVWNLHTGELEHTFCDHWEWVRAVAVTEDGEGAIASSDMETLEVWNLKTGELELQHTLWSLRSPVEDIAIAPDGKWVISASRDHTLKVWHLYTGEFEQTFPRSRRSVYAIAITPDGKSVISASGHNEILKVWHLQTGVLEKTFTGHCNQVDSVAISLDGARAIFVSYDDDNTLKVWNLYTGKLEYTFCGHSDPVNALAITPDGKRAISASDDKTLKVWNLYTGELEHTLTGHSDSVMAVAITPDGQRAISSSGDRTVKVWDLHAGELERTFYGHRAPVGAIALTDDGNRVISGSFDYTVKVWNLHAGELEHTFSGHRAWVYAVAVSPNGERVISASNDETLKVWNLDTGELERTLSGYSDWIHVLALSPGEEQVISTLSPYGTSLKIWDLKTGDAIASFSGDGSIACCAISPDLQMLAVGEHSGEVHFLRLVGLPQP